MTNSIFTVSSKDLDRLSESDAVTIFAELLWAEATSVGIHKSLINVPSAITVADGGIDAEVRSVTVSAGQGIIKEGLTRYQIKTGDFSLGHERNVRSVLFKDGASELKPKVKSCLDNGGTLIIVLFGWDNPEPEDDQVINKFLGYLTKVDSRYGGAKIEIFQQNKLISFIKGFPSLALRINGRDKLRFQTHHSWSQQDIMRHSLKVGEKQVSFIEKIREKLRNDSEAVHVRVMGAAGIGKTRLALEATKADDLKPLVVYCDAKEFKSSELMNEILRDDNMFSSILVLNECDGGSQREIWNQLKNRGKRVKLISIYNEKEDWSGATEPFEVDLLENKQLIEIFCEYGLTEDQANRWVSICGGSPGVAHLIGGNIQNGSANMLLPLDTVDVLQNVIATSNTRTPLEERRIVLQQIALFKRFGHSETLEVEAKAIAKRVAEINPQVTFQKFKQIVAGLKKQKILQGNDTLYITPEALHIKLWSEWWDNYGEFFDLKDFITDLPKNLKEWFFRMFVYAGQCETALKKVREILSYRGLFRNVEALQAEPSLFMYLTEADPKAALACLKRVLGGLSKEQLLAFSKGRREVVYALEKIVVWKDLFIGGARLLLVLAEAENETCGNNAKGTFIDLFSPGYGWVSPTEASLKGRFPLLEESLGSDSKERRLISLQACEKALITEGFSRTAGAEYQGLRKDPELWIPETYEEWFGAYRDVWQLLRKKLETLEGDEQDKIIDILLNNTIGIGSIKCLFDMVFETVKELAQRSSKDKKKVLKVVVRLVHYYQVNNGDSDRIPDEILQKWETFKAELIGDDFSSLLRRYVGMDLLEDKFDKDNNYVDQREKPIKNLVAQVIQEPSLLLPELSWLVTKEAKNGLNFGYELAVKDGNYSLLPLILDAQKNAFRGEGSAAFLGGYFRVLAQKDAKRYEEKLDELVLDSQLNVWVSELSYLAGFSNRGALRVFELAKKGVVKTKDLINFCSERFLKDVSEKVFGKWIVFLAEEAKDKDDIFVALEIFCVYYLSEKGKPKFSDRLAIKLLLHPILFKESGRSKSTSVGEYHWEKLANAFVHYYSREGLLLAKRIFYHLGKSGTILDTIRSKYRDVLSQIAKLYPGEVWVLVAKYLEPKSEFKNCRRSSRIQAWLREGLFCQGRDGGSVLSLLKEVFVWIDSDVENRAGYIAKCIPFDLLYTRKGVSVAREMLIAYGDNGKVRSQLITTFLFGAVSAGLLSEYYQNKKQSLVDFRKNESQEKVLIWIDECLDTLDEQIGSAKIGEEREDY